MMNIEAAIQQISRLKHLLSLPSTNVVWSTYESAVDVIEDLELLEKGLREKDKNARQKLLDLFTPYSRFAGNLSQQWLGR